MKSTADDFLSKVKAQDSLTLFVEWLDSPLYSGSEKAIIRQELRTRAGQTQEKSAPKRTPRGKRGDWRFFDPRGERWSKEAYWRCQLCGQTFPPQDFEPNPRHYCKACETGEEYP